MAFYVFNPDFEMMEFQPRRRPSTCRRGPCSRPTPRFCHPWDRFMAEDEARRPESVDFGTALNVLDSLASSIFKEISEAQKQEKKDAPQEKSDQQTMDTETPKEAVAETPKEVVAETPKEVVAETPKEVVAPKKVVSEAPVKQVFKRFGTKVSVNENMEKTEIKIELLGHKFKPEDLEVQVVDGNVLVVKAEEGEPKFERRFNLPAKSLVDKIESVFNMKEEDKQTLTIKIPKDLKVVQVPISLMEE